MMITLYSKPDCPYCDRAADYFKTNNFQFTKVDVIEDATALEFIKSKGHRTVPQIYLEGRLLVEGGYDGLSKLRPNDLTHRMQQHVNGKAI
jgi:glutaredoxin-like protein NrdH